MELKDILTITLSSLAFIVSLGAAIITQRQKQGEVERTLRQQITDVIGKLSSVFAESDKHFRDYEDKDKDGYFFATRAALNGQLRFLARQAVYLAAQTPKRISDAEYGMIARSFDALGDYDQAKIYWRMSIDASPSQQYRGYNMRGLARMLFNEGSYDDGRGMYADASQCFLGSPQNETMIWDQAETYQRWAESELDIGAPDKAAQCIEKAADIYGDISTPGRRARALSNLAVTQARLARTRVQGQETQ